MKSATYKFASGGYAQQSYDDWLCSDVKARYQGSKRKSGFCKAYLPELKANPAEWTVDGARVAYCLSQPAGDVCKLYFSPAIAGAVISMNAIKAICIGLVLYTLKDTPLLTLGDAVASFLDFPDDTTSNMGVVSRGDLRSSNGYSTWISGPKLFDASRKRRFHATGRGRIVGFMSLQVPSHTLQPWYPH